jgi:transcriptional regulator with PAS, ATPase and Fis domain
LDRFITASQLIHQVREIVERVASNDVPVLLIGESGVGKGVLARYLHTTGRFADGPFVKVNCAALPRDLLESELFGHERGAFTGAVARKPGRFEQAAGGTILLDEIGELPLDLQAKLLHVLDDASFTRVGGTKELTLDARIVAATNKSLEQAVAKGTFRDDLYFRLAVVWVEVPPLRKRPEDIVALAEHFFAQYGGKYGVETDGDPTAELLNAMVEYDWPGNVRELKNFVQRCVLFPDQRQNLNELRRPRHQISREVEVEDGASLLDIGAAAADRAERQAALTALKETAWNRKAAAKRLKVSYKTLLNKLHKWEEAEAYRRNDS